MRKLLTLFFVLVCFAAFAQTRPHQVDMRTFATIDSIRAVPAAITGTWAVVRGYHSESDGGGGVFFYDATSTVADDGGTVIAPTGVATGRWLRDFSGSLNPKWFGAKGDGTGSTPASDSVNIESAAWNTWDGTLFKTDAAYSPFWVTASFVPPRAKPFYNTDSWDYIGLSLALWKGMGVKIPTGTYKINLSGGRGTYNGLLLMRGMEQLVSGEGRHQSIIAPTENAAFFAANNVGTQHYYKLISLYRVSGPGSTWRDLLLTGPGSYAAANKNLTHLFMENCNGINFNSIWVTTADVGFFSGLICSDMQMSEITTEFLFSAVLADGGALSEWQIMNCNFWVIGAVQQPLGIDAASSSFKISDTDFVGFANSPIVALKANLVGCDLSFASAIGGCRINIDSVISSNKFYGNHSAPLLNVIGSSTVSGNLFLSDGNHACINMGDGTAAANITISGNTVMKTNNAVEAQNFAITALKSGVDYVSAATATCFITGNVITGRALASASMPLATIKNNVRDGVYEP